VRRVILTIVPLAVLAGAAHADSRHACEAVDADTIAVDGILDDWQGIDKLRIGGTDRDASLDVRCAMEGASIALSFDVRDEHVVRSAVAVGPGDDLLEVTLAGSVLTIAPGLGSIPPQVKLDGKPAPKWIAVESGSQKAGWSVELVLPIAKLRGVKAGASELDAKVSYRDGDVMHGKAPERTVGDAIVFELGGGGDSAPAPTAKDTMTAFLHATGLGAHDVTLDATADVDPSVRGAEHVVAGGRVIGILGEKFTFVQLPADRDTDVIAKPKLADLRGDGTRVIVAVVREQGGGGTRDLLLGFGARNGQLAQMFAIEVRRERGAQKLESEWSIKPGQGKKRPQIVVKALPAVGWDADSYDEGPSGDAEPIALPWDDDRWGAAYTLDGDALTSHPLPGKRTTK
jgi:hypothetical protein